MEYHRKSSRSRRGTAVVEMAVILPLFLLLIFGVIKYGWLVIKWQQITNTARYSVRYAVRPAATTALTETLIGTLMTDAGMGSTGYKGIDGAPLVAGANLDAEAEVVVGIQVDVDQIDILPIPLLPAPKTLSARMTMSKEGDD
jgi:Flp pilus assembly protein TadG